MLEIGRKYNDRYELSIKNLNDENEIDKITINKDMSVIVHCVNGTTIDIGVITNLNAKFLEVRDLLKLLQVINYNNSDYDSNSK